MTTPDAERILGIPRDSLKRIYSDATEGGRGILKHGIHWKRGANRNASHNWNIPACMTHYGQQGTSSPTPTLLLPLLGRRVEVGRKSKLRQKRKAALPFNNTLTPAAVSFQKQLDTDIVQAFKFMGVCMVMTDGTSSNGTFFHTLPSVKKVRALMQSDDSQEYFCGGMTMSFLSFGLLADLWCELEIKNPTLLRLMFVHLCKQEFIAEDHAQFYERDTFAVGRNVESIIGQLLNGFALCTDTLRQRLNKKTLPKKAINTSVLVEGFRTHLVTSALLNDEHCDFFLFRQGRVCLYKTNDLLTGEEDMSLAIQSEDGLWTYSPDLILGSTPPIKDLAALREWVRNYSGQKRCLLKTISRRSAKLLKWLGFEVVSRTHPFRCRWTCSRLLHTSTLMGLTWQIGTSMAVTLRARPQPSTGQNEQVLAA